MPQQREKVEEAVTSAIKDIANISRKYKILFSGTATALVGSIFYIAYRQ